MIFLSCTEKKERKKERKNIYYRRDRTLYSQSCTTNICYQQLQQRFQYRSSATLQLKIKPASRVLMMPQGRNPIQLKSLFDPDHAAWINCRLQNTNLEHQALEELRSRRIGGSESLEGRSCCCCCCAAAAATATKNQQKQQQLQKEHCATAAYFPTLTALVHPFTHRIFLHLAVLRLLVTGSSVFTLRARKH